MRIDIRIPSEESTIRMYPMVFTSIGHLIDMKMLKECHAKMDKDKRSLI